MATEARNGVCQECGRASRTERACIYCGGRVEERPPSELPPPLDQQLAKLSDEYDARADQIDRAERAQDPLLCLFIASGVFGLTLAAIVIVQIVDRGPVNWEPTLMATVAVTAVMAASGVGFKLAAGLFTKEYAPFFKGFILAVLQGACQVGVVVLSPSGLIAVLGSLISLGGIIYCTTRLFGVSGWQGFLIYLLGGTVAAALAGIVAGLFIPWVEF